MTTAIVSLGACRTWGVDSENRPQRGQFLPDLQPHSPAMGQKDGEKWTAAVDSQSTLPKPDRLGGNALGLPPALRTAQAAIQLPEVQEMLRRLSAHGLGICMPHMHDEKTGEFQPLADQLVQVEAGLAVSFQATAEIATHAGRFLPVAWVWRDGLSMPSAVCEMVRDEDGPDVEEPPVKHKHPTRN